jgi:hypothetical protein
VQGSPCLRERYKKYRNIGEHSSHFRAPITREVSTLRDQVSSGVRRIARRGANKTRVTVDPAMPHEPQKQREEASAARAYPTAPPTSLLTP